jgi:PAS domain S-box-containing protein
MRQTKDLPKASAGKTKSHRESKKVREALIKSKAILNSVIDSTKDMIWTVSADDFRLLMFNKALSDYFLRTQNLQVKKGMTTRQLMPTEALAQRWRELIQKALKEGTFSAEYTTSVEPRTFELNFNLVKRGEKPFGISVFAKDITERKKAEEELCKAFKETKRREAEVSALLVAAKSVLQNLDFKSSARIIFNSCKELIGATSGYVALLSDDGKDNIVIFLESGGLPCTVDPSLPMPIRGLRATAYNTGRVMVENNFNDSEWTKFLPEGHVKLQNVLFSPLKVEHRTVGIIGLANKVGGFTEHDAELALAFGDIASIALINSNMIDMLEENQKKLAEYSGNLEALVEEKTKKLKDSEALAAIGATAGMVGHDIRNPLQAIVSDVYLLRSELSSLPDGDAKESMKESLDGINDNICYVDKIVQDLQDFARPFKPLIREVDLVVLLEDALLKNSAIDGIDFCCQVDRRAKRLVTDPEMLKRIVNNLISNAIQAMPQGGKLDVNASRQKESIKITVADTGVGIPEDIKPKLFSPLFTTKSKGQGFGLAVVKRMTEALGGSVTFESKVGEGTKFIVSLPLNKTDV